MSTSERPILLVEDDPLLRDALRLLLEDAGYRVREAGNAAEALDLSTADPPSLILLDLGLPDRPGLEVARILRARMTTRETPIVALTGRVGAGERNACFAAGCTSFLAKPVEPRELLRCLPEFLRAG
ncbi:MAG TPA: response regulator [Longimicrobiales bacterium]